jgi:ferritin-like metal-binding protein YciE
MPRWNSLKGHVMAEKDPGELFLHTLKAVDFAEHEILKTLPKMAQAARNGR